MRTGQLLAALGLLTVCAAQGGNYALAGIPLSTTLTSFTARYPGAICSTLDKFCSCRLDGISIAGVTPTRSDFNFDSATLTSINFVFQPSPSDEQLNAIEEELTKLHGQPQQREVSPSHHLHAVWTDGRTRLMLTVRTDRTFIILESVR